MQAQSYDDPTKHDYPAKPVHIVVGFTPGGGPDITARYIAQKLADAWKQQVVVENRPGAGGTIAASQVAAANPDGYTLLSVSSAHAVAPAIYPRLPYDPQKDFAGVTLSAVSKYLLVVSPSLGARTLQDLLGLAKARPGALNFSSAGVGSGTHFAGELLKVSAHIDVVHVPFKGIPEAVNDVVAGRVQLMMTPPSTVGALVKDGKLRALGVTGKERIRSYPDLPTIAESGVPGFLWETWAAIFAPSKTPRAIIDKLNREITGALRMPDVQQRLLAMEAEPAPSTPAELDALVARDIAKIAELARKAGIKPQ